MCTACPLQFCDVIKSYPLQPQPEIFGLHVNADITCQQAETYELLATVLGLQPRTTSSSSAADSQEAVVARVAKAILDKVRHAWKAPAL
jgi:dynein heavy chain